MRAVGWRACVVGWRVRVVAWSPFVHVNIKLVWSVVAVAWHMAPARVWLELEDGHRVGVRVRVTSMAFGCGWVMVVGLALAETQMGVGSFAHDACLLLLAWSRSCLLACLLLLAWCDCVESGSGLGYEPMLLATNARREKNILAFCLTLGRLTTKHSNTDASSASQSVSQSFSLSVCLSVCQSVTMPACQDC